MIDYNNMKVLFIVLSLAAVLLLPIKRLNRSQKFAYPPRLRDPEELRGNRISSSSNNHSMPFIRVLVIIFNQGAGISNNNKTRQYYINNTSKCKQ